MILKWGLKVKSSAKNTFSIQAGRYSAQDHRGKGTCVKTHNASKQVAMKKASAIMQRRPRMIILTLFYVQPDFSFAMFCLMSLLFLALLNLK